MILSLMCSLACQAIQPLRMVRASQILSLPHLALGSKSISQSWTYLQQCQRRTYQLASGLDLGSKGIRQSWTHLQQCKRRVDQ